MNHRCFNRGHWIGYPFQKLQSLLLVPEKEREEACSPMGEPSSRCNQVIIRWFPPSPKKKWWTFPILGRVIAYQALVNMFTPKHVPQHIRVRRMA